MAYNFNKTPERRNTNSIKWTRYPADVIPLWVADMDFQAPKPILNGLRAMIDHGVLGYDIPTTALQETVASRMDALYKWKVKPEAVSAVTGIVTGFSVAARAFGSPKKGIMIQTPVYNEFHEVKNNIGIPQLDVPLVKSVAGNIMRYEIDWDMFKKQAKKAGMFLLCNPHNPLGIIYSRKDLQRMAEICLENNVLMISDEIHSELLLDGNKFTPMAKLSSEIANHTITLVAPSKTFNVPGLFCGFAIIPNQELRERYNKMVEHLRIHVSSTGLQAAQIGFSGQCDEWLAELRTYLTANRDFLVEYVTKYMPNVRTTIPAATYLGWLDFTQTPVNVSPYDFFLKEAKVAFSDGKVFGKEGEGHLRINYGTSRRILKDGLDRIRKALESM
jgi:cystathionine beta-lyase